jgi:hypothetical protein
MNKIGLLLLFYFLSYTIIYAQTNYTWTGANNGSWTISTNWSPTRTTPAINDIIQFNDGTTKTITGVSAQTIGQLIVSNNSKVTLQSSSTATLSIGGGAGTDLSITAGSQLNISGTNALSISLGTGATGIISGSMNFSGGAHRLLATDVSGITFQNGSVFTTGTGFSGNAFGTTNLNSVVFSNGSQFVFTAGSDPFGAVQPNSVVVFQTGSLYKHSASSAPTFLGRTYANFELDAPSLTVTATAGATGKVSINNLTITNGTLNFNVTATPGHSIKGNIFVNGGATLNFAPATSGTVNLNGSSEQTIGGTGTISFTASSTINVDNLSGVTLTNNLNMEGNLILINGAFTVGAHTFILGRPIGGIPTRLTADNYSSITIAGTVSEVNIPSSVSQLNNLVVNNTNGTTLQGSLAIVGSLTLTSGLLNVGANTLSLSNLIIGTPSNLNADYTSSIIITGSGSGINIPSNISNLTDLTLNNSNGTVLQGSLNLGGTLYLEKGNISLGNNNLTVAAFDGTYSGSSLSYIVTNGTGGLTIDNIDANNYSFPVGFTDDYTPIILNNSGAVDNFTVSVKNSFDYAPITDQVVNKQWTITEAGTGANVTATFQWNSRDESGTFIRTEPFIGRWNGMVWTDKTASYNNLGGGISTAMTNGITAFTLFEISNDVSLPCELSSFTSELNGKDVCLNWETKTEKNSYKFDIERKVCGTDWISVGSIKAADISNSNKQYSFTDKNVQSGKYQYRLKMINNDISFIYSKVNDIEVTSPKCFELSQNYPNPFNPTTKIDYQLPEDSKVLLEVYNVEGKKVAEIVNQNQPAGYYTIDFGASVKLSSGVYIYRIITSDNSGGNNFSAIKKMILLK